MNCNWNQQLELFVNITIVMWYQNGKKLIELHVCTIYLAYKKWKKEKSMKFERNYIYNIFFKIYFK